LIFYINDKFCQLGKWNNFSSSTAVFSIFFQ